VAEENVEEGKGVGKGAANENGACFMVLYYESMEEIIKTTKNM
jgi:hypothetical protein